jgi:hypothetical protein
MVRLTWVPVSLPGSMATGVMVATGAIPPPAVGGASAVGGAPAPPAMLAELGWAASEAEISLLLSNILSMSLQPASPAVSTQARRRPGLRPRLAGYPLILLSAAGAPAPG